MSAIQCAPTSRTGGSLTRERFLLAELRLVARLRCEGIADDEIIRRAAEENLFQFPTTKESRSIARACLARLDTLNDESLVRLVAEGTPMQAIQANIYAMMRLYDLMRAFMIEEVGGHYLTMNPVLTRTDINAFMTRYQMECEAAVGWSEATIKRLKGTLHHCLIEGGYLRQGSDELMPVLLDPAVEAGIRDNGDAAALAAFGVVGA